MPQRAYAREIIKVIEAEGIDDDIISFIKKKYRLVLLTKEETAMINKLNRSKITDDRIADAGIELYKI